MLSASLNFLDPQIKTTDSIASHNVLDGLAFIRQRNEALVEALDQSLEDFEQVLAFYQQDAYAA